MNYEDLFQSKRKGLIVAFLVYIFVILLLNLEYKHQISDEKQFLRQLSQIELSSSLGGMHTLFSYNS